MAASERRSDFQTKCLKREREKERSKEYSCRQKQYYKILHEYYQVEEVILCFEQYCKAFLRLRGVAVHEFSGISKKILKENSVMKSKLINVAKRRI